MPLSAPQQSASPFNLNLLLNFLLTLPQEVICVFHLISALAILASHSPENPNIYQKTLFYHFTSLRLAFLIGLLSPLKILLLSLTRREPSPVLVGLATRLSLV